MTGQKRYIVHPGGPPLDCSSETLIDYIRSMQGGERVMELGGSCMTGMRGTVERRKEAVSIRWDYAEYADGKGCMVTSFTGSARVILEEGDPLFQFALAQWWVAGWNEAMQKRADERDLGPSWRRSHDRFWDAARRLLDIVMKLGENTDEQ